MPMPVGMIDVVDNDDTELLVKMTGAVGKFGGL
jgi:hypothetical protein